MSARRAQGPADAESLPEGFDRRYASEARPYTIWDAPRAVKRIFSKFPLQTASSERRPAHLSPLVQTQKRNRIQFWSNTLIGDALVPSFNVNCLKYQALLLANGVQFDVIPTVAEGAPSGRLPFIYANNSSKQISLVRSVDVEHFIQEKGLEQGVSPSTQEDEIRQTEGLGILEKDVRAAWLYSCYLTPENFRNVVFKLYVASVTNAHLSHYAMLNRIYADARDEFGKLEYTVDLGRSSWTSSAPPSHLDLAVSLNKRAGAALDHLVELLDNDTFFSGSDRPGILDASVFAYTYLLTAHTFTDGAGWIDTRLGDEFRRREALMRHQQAVYSHCFGQDIDESQISQSIFTNIPAESSYQESQSSYAEINESAYDGSQHSYEEVRQSQIDSHEDSEAASPPAIRTQESFGELSETSFPESSQSSTVYVNDEDTRSSHADETATQEADAAAMTSSHLFA